MSTTGVIICSFLLGVVAGSFIQDWICSRKRTAGIKMTTNGDRIRKMNNEELAVTLMCPGSNGMGMAKIECDPFDDRNCCKCLLDWLNQEVEEE